MTTWAIWETEENRNPRTSMSQIRRRVPGKTCKTGKNPNYPNSRKGNNKISNVNHNQHTKKLNSTQ